jgi:endonuclease/exonuclease/phosphatase family metal-dependent hydrolase
MVACTHLSYRPEDASVRVSQVEEVLRTLAETSTSAPPRGETVQTIVAGDLNDTSDSPAIATLEGRGFVDTYHRLHPHDPSPTWAERNPFTALQDPQLPDRRIDYIFVDPRLAQSLRSCEIVLNLPDEAGVFPSDHFGVIAEFR